MVATEHARDLVYAGPGEVNGELGDCPQHLLRRYDRVGNMGIYNKGESGEQEVASHHWGGDGQSESSFFVGLNI